MRALLTGLIGQGGLAVLGALGRRWGSRIHGRFAPTPGSGLNLVEVWFGIIERQPVAGQIVGFGSVTLATFAVGAGHVALQQIKSRGGRGRTLALFALAISYAAGIWGLVTTVYWAILLAGATVNP